MNRKKQVILALAAAVLLVALALTAGLRDSGESMVQVLTTRNRITAGSALKADDLVLVDLPSRLMISSYLMDPKAVIGQSVDRDLQQGQLIDRSWLHEDPNGIAYPDARPDGRLYSLRLQPEQANGFWIATGNRVDIHLIPKGEAIEGLPDLLPGIRILSLIGSGKNEDSGAAASVLPGPSSSGSALVCLDVNTAQARVLAQAETRYVIKLVPLNEPMIMIGNPSESEPPLEASAIHEIAESD